MSAIYAITPDKLARLIGTPACPILVDVRIDEDFDADPTFVPGAVRRSHANVAEWAPGLQGKTVVAICKRGQKLSEGVAAWLRHAGAAANVLDGGTEAWAKEKLPRNFRTAIRKAVPSGSRAHGPRSIASPVPG
jgi:rhodanese-related sulfurtransferase